MVTLQVFNVFVALASFVLASYVDTREREERVSRLYMTAQLSNEAKSEFMKMASHELRGPLSVIKGYLTLLQDGSLGDPPQRWREPLDILIGKTTELGKIMDDLLEVSRLDGGESPRERAPVDIQDLIVSAVERARPRAALAEGQITVASALDSITVMADPRQLGRIMDNLISNGLSYTLRPPSVSIHATTRGERVLIRVSDQGAGIEASMRERIFEPFRRGEGALNQRVPGTGLGLYISRQLAEANGGSLVLESSRQDAGSTFTLDLPIAAPAPERALRVSPATA